MSKEHLDLFPLPPRSDIGFRFGDIASHVASALMDGAWYFARRGGAMSRCFISDGRVSGVPVALDQDALGVSNCLARPGTTASRQLQSYSSFSKPGIKPMRGSLLMSLTLVASERHKPMPIAQA